MRDEILGLGTQGLGVAFDSLYSDPNRNLIVIENLSLAPQNETSCLANEGLMVREVRIQGFSLLAFLTNGTIRLRRVIINDPTLAFSPPLGNANKDVAPAAGNTRVRIAELRLNGLHMLYADSGACQFATEGRTGAVLQNLTVDLPLTKLANVRASAIQLFETHISLEQNLYALDIQRIEINPGQKSLSMDTLTITPQLSKSEFTKRIGYERDRIEGTIPFIRVDDLVFNSTDSTAVRASRMRLQGFLKFFRDKRLPHKGVTKPLPQRHLANLPFQIHVDSIVIEKSYVAYEEYAEGADAPGKIFFDDLEGTIANVTNAPTGKNNKVRVSASARFMASAIAKLSAELDLNGGASSASGSLQHLRLNKLNTLLEPMAGLQINSGQLNSLNFRFQFNDFRADGSATLDYQDLRIISLREGETRQEEKKKDNIETFILNTFIIKKTMSRGMSQDDRTGTILFERDRTRSVFNYWWKSVFTGIKAAMGIANDKK